MDTTDLTADWFPWRLFISLLSQSTFYHFAASTKVPSATFGFYWTFKTSLRNSETVLIGLAVGFYTFTHRLEFALLNVLSVSSKFLHKQNQTLLLCQDFPWMPCSSFGGISGFNLVVVVSLAGTLAACQRDKGKSPAAGTVVHNVWWPFIMLLEALGSFHLFRVGKSFTSDWVLHPY